MKVSQFSDMWPHLPTFYTIVVLLLSGCEDGPGKTKLTMMTVGTYSSSDNLVCWKDSAEQILTNDFIHALGKDVFISEGNVYIAGSQRIRDIWVATYWVNGENPVSVADFSVAPTPGDTMTFTNSIWVSGSDVHLTCEKYFTGNKIYQQALYLVNGVKIKLEGVEDVDLSAAGQIYIHGSDVYIAGHLGHNPVYWKNGKLKILSDFGESRDIVVSSGDVYVVGVSKGNATLWKNGVETTLEGSEANAIFLDGNDVYIAGMDTGACYWKNGVKTSLSQNFSLATGVTVFDHHLYVTGHDQMPIGGGHVSVACYWKDGLKKNLARNKRTSSVCNAIMFGLVKN